MSVCTIIPARGGSRGVPGKNIRPFEGKPLITHSITHALAASGVDHVFVSTDDKLISETALAAGAKVIRRPPELAGDTASSESALEHAINEIANMGIRARIIVFLQATSPLRPPGAIDNALNLFTKGGYDSLLSISPTHKFFWRVEGDEAIAEYDLNNRPRRQDIKPHQCKYVENGSLYIFTVEHFKKTGNRLGGRIGWVIFDEEYSLEIDSENDFYILEKFASTLRCKHHDKSV